MLRVCDLMYNWPHLSGLDFLGYYCIIFCLIFLGKSIWALPLEPFFLPYTFMQILEHLSLDISLRVLFLIHPDSSGVDHALWLYTPILVCWSWKPLWGPAFSCACLSTWCMPHLMTLLSWTFVGWSLWIRSRSWNQDWNSYQYIA